MKLTNWILAATVAALMGAAPLAGAADDPSTSSNPSDTMSNTSNATESGKSDLKSAFKDLKASCKDDINKYCSDIKPGGGRLAACLNSNASNLSTACNDARQKTNQLVSQAHMNFEKQCGSDVQKFCSNETNRMAIHDCLNQHLDSLSSSCKNLTAKINQRIDKGLG